MVEPGLQPIWSRGSHPPAHLPPHCLSSSLEGNGNALSCRQRWLWSEDSDPSKQSMSHLLTWHWPARDLSPQNHERKIWLILKPWLETHKPFEKKWDLLFNHQLPLQQSSQPISSEECAKNSFPTSEYQLCGFLSSHSTPSLGMPSIVFPPSPEWTNAMQRWGHDQVKALQAAETGSTPTIN